MRKLLAGVSVVIVLALAALGLTARAATGSQDTTFACISSTHTFTHVGLDSPRACPSQQPVSWPVSAGPVPSPSPSSTATASPTATPSPTGTNGPMCVVTQSTGNPCSLGTFAGIPGSNQYNLYGGNDCWADPTCTFTSTFYDAGNWSVQANEPAGNTSVKAYPDVQHLYDSPDLSSLSSLTSTYAEDVGATSGTIAWAAYDVWLNNWAAEILIAVDNHNIDPTYLPVVGHFTVDGEGYTLYDNGSERVVVADTNQQSGTVDIQAVLGQVQALGKLPAANTLNAVDFGWEIDSTGGQQETFSVSNYSLSS